MAEPFPPMIYKSKWVNAVALAMVLVVPALVPFYLIWIGMGRWADIRGQRGNP